MNLYILEQISNVHYIELHDERSNIIFSYRVYTFTKIIDPIFSELGRFLYLVDSTFLGIQLFYM